MPMRAGVAAAALWGFLACAGILCGQVPTSFDLADMTEGRDPAQEARRHLGKAQDSMRKVLKLERHPEDPDHAWLKAWLGP